MNKKERAFVKELMDLHNAGDLKLTLFTGKANSITDAIDTLDLSLTVARAKVPRALRRDLDAVKVLLQSAGNIAEEAGL